MEGKFQNYHLNKSFSPFVHHTLWMPKEDGEECGGVVPDSGLFWSLVCPAGGSDVAPGRLLSEETIQPSWSDACLLSVSLNRERSARRYSSGAPQGHAPLQLVDNRINGNDIRVGEKCGFRNEIKLVK